MMPSSRDNFPHAHGVGEGASYPTTCERGSHLRWSRMSNVSECPFPLVAYFYFRPQAATYEPHTDRLLRHR